MRIIALMNQKGGVGKTTTTVNLSAALAEQGKKVCVIDLDPQAHATINFGVEPTADHISLYDVLIDDKSFLEAVHSVDTNTALVASSIDLAGAEIELVNVIGREVLLKKKIEQAQHDFDFMLLDCPPSLGLLTLNALAVAHEVLIPMQPHFLALQGVAKLLETVHLVSRRINPQLKVCGIVLTMYDAQTKLTSEVVAELNGFIESAKGKPLPWASAKVFNTKIRRNIKLAESPSFGQTILKYDPSSNGAFDYRNLARELIGLPPIAAPAPAARPAVAAADKPTSAPTSAPAAVIVTAKPVAGTPSLPPKPVMPPALVAAMKAQATKKAGGAAATPPPAAAPAPTARTEKAASGRATATGAAGGGVPSGKTQATTGASTASAGNAQPRVTSGVPSEPAGGAKTQATAGAPPASTPPPAAAVRPLAAPRPLPSTVTAPIPSLALTAPPPSAAKQQPAPRPAAAAAAAAPRTPAPPPAAPARTPAPAATPPKPEVTVTVAPAIDQSKLAATAAKENAAAERSSADADAAA